MYGTLRGALAGRKIAFDRESYTATVEGRIAGIGKTIHIKSIHVHYELTVPAEAREATERALAAHPLGCPAHQSVKNAIQISWSATLKAGDQVLSIREETPDAASAIRTIREHGPTWRANPSQVRRRATLPGVPPHACTHPVPPARSRARRYE
jgi:hypothetical protein